MALISTATTAALAVAPTLSSTALSSSMIPSAPLLVHPLVELCGKLAPMASVALFLAPIPTIRQVIQTKSTLNLPLLPYSSMIANTFVWVTYGFLKQDQRIWSANLMGLILGMYYFTSFVRHVPTSTSVSSKENTSSSTMSDTVLASSPTAMVRQHIQACAAVVGVTSILATRKATHLIGMGGLLCCIVLFASPLAALRTVLETKSSDSIALPFTLASIMNCLLWTVSGVFDMKDMNVIIPNSIGLALGIVQVALKWLYRNASGRMVQSTKSIVPKQA